MDHPHRLPETLILISMFAEITNSVTSLGAWNLCIIISIKILIIKKLKARVCNM